MSERIIVDFKARGDKKLIQSMYALAQAQGLLEKNTKKAAAASGLLGTAFDRNARGASDYSLALSTLRSRLLLVSFAMSMGGRQLVDFGKKAANIESMERAFNNLQGGTTAATVAIEQLRGATSNAMSDFDLFQQANNAMVLGITKNSSEMANMFKMAQRLGRALGVDTKRSVESLVTGIGRQSRLMLDNIGIVVKADEAYKEYAEKLGKSADKLTDVEKKQAFLNATLDAAREKVAKLGDDIPATIDAYDELTAAWANYTAKVGESVNQVLVPLSKVLAKIFKFVSSINTEFEGFGGYLTQLMDIFKGDFSVLFPTLQATADSIKGVSTAVDDATYSFNNMDDDAFGQFLQFAPAAGELNEELEKMNFKMIAGQINSLTGAMASYALMSQTGSRTWKEFGSVVVSTIERIIATFLANLATFKLMSFLLGGPMAGFAGASKALEALQRPTLFGFHQGGQVQEYHTGGMIPQYHSGGNVDNVPIMAQEGEFVMRRSAVESIGLENLNRMNRTGQASGGANITFTGNIMSDSFIEEEAIPKIKDAIRRGADLGIS
jgi:uncharacterized protein YoxC